MFAKFANTADRDETVKAIRKASFKEGGNTIWAKADQPLHNRVIMPFVFGAKYILKNWDFTSNSVWADPEAGKV